MSMAQAEAVLVAASCPELSIDVLLAKALLSQASDNGPAALASSASVRQTLERLTEMQAVADEVRLQRLHFHPAIHGHS
jgi:hypothetical protein